MLNFEFGSQKAIKFELRIAKLSFIVQNEKWTILKDYINTSGLMMFDVSQLSKHILLVLL